MKSNFWGPMAVAISSGLFGATVLTLLVLPTMYAVWFKVTPKEITYLKEKTSIKSVKFLNNKICVLDQQDFLFLAL